MKLFALTLLVALGLASATTPEGKAWLAANLEKDGVSATDSGLQYKVIKSGESGAPSPLAGTPCACHYRGTLIDGQEFDSSYKRGQPSTFAPNQVRATRWGFSFLVFGFCFCFFCFGWFWFWFWFWVWVGLVLVLYLWLERPRFPPGDGPPPKRVQVPIHPSLVYVLRPVACRTVPPQESASAREYARVVDEWVLEPFGAVRGWERDDHSNSVWCCLGIFCGPFLGRGRRGMPAYFTLGGVLFVFVDVAGGAFLWCWAARNAGPFSTTRIILILEKAARRAAARRPEDANAICQMFDANAVCQMLSRSNLVLFCCACVCFWFLLSPSFLRFCFSLACVVVLLPTHADIASRRDSCDSSHPFHSHCLPPPPLSLFFFPSLSYR